MALLTFACWSSAYELFKVAFSWAVNYKKIVISCHISLSTALYTWHCLIVYHMIILTELCLELNDRTLSPIHLWSWVSTTSTSFYWPLTLSLNFNTNSKTNTNTNSDNSVYYSLFTELHFTNYSWASKFRWNYTTYIDAVPWTLGPLSCLTQIDVEE